MVAETKLIANFVDYKKGTISLVIPIYSYYPLKQPIKL